MSVQQKIHVSRRRVSCAAARMSRVVALRVWLGALLAVLVCVVLPATPAAASPGAFGPLSVQGLSLSAPALTGGGDPSFGEPGEGAGQIGNTLFQAYEEEGSDLAIDHITHEVYIADTLNRRIDEFSEDGKFERAWGWGVDKASPEAKLQECTSTSGCQVGEGGGGAGEFGQPVGIAVDGEAGREAVYVLESFGDYRVQEFTLSGAFVRMWGGKVNKKGGNACTAAEASECQAGSPGPGDGEFGEAGLQGAIAVGPTGLVYVGDFQRVQWFAATTGAFEGSFPVVATKGQVEALAVTFGGNICLTINVSEFYKQKSPPGEVLCYDSNGTLKYTIELEEQPYKRTANAFIGLAADGSGRLFVDQYERVNLRGETVQAIYEYSETGQELERLLPPGGEAGSREREPGGFALSESAGAASGVAVFDHHEKVVRSEALPPPGPVVLGQEGKPGEPASTATLEASIDPEGHETEFFFEYGTEPSKETATASVKLSAKSFTPEATEAGLSGLKAGTVYHFHVVAKNSEGTVDGPDQTVTTLPPLRVDAVFASEVSAQAATLEARVDPLGSAGEYRFEYAAQGEELHVTETLPILAGKEDVTIAAHVRGLRADTGYVYRVIAGNSLGQAQPVEARLVTQPAGAPFALLDGRAWEQVSPPNKGVADISLFWSGGALRATPNGEAIAYISRGGSEAEPQGEPTYADNVSRRGTNGWATHDIAPPNAQRYNFGLAELGQYWLFSEDLRRSVLVSSPYTALSQWTTEPTEYLRDEAKCPQGVVSLAQIQASECFIPLLTDEGPFADVKEGVRFSNAGGGATSGSVNVNEATPDLSHIVLRENNSMTAELVAGAGAHGLYEWSAGRELAPLSLTPQGTACEHAVIGAPEGTLEEGTLNEGKVRRNALSPDGNLAVWSTLSNVAVCGGHLYLRDVAKEKTIQLDEVQSGSGAGGPDAYYQDASVGDEHVFFTDSQWLTEGSTGFQGPAASAADLYEYSFDRASDTGSLVDMTKPVAVGEAAGVLGVAGASEDGAVVYAIATGVLSAEANARDERAVSGGHNLYKLERTEGSWKATFIAVLSATDQTDWGLKGMVTANNGREVEQSVYQTTRVSSDGKWLAFMSDHSLTGYDNEDVTSETPGERMDEEVFLYDANDNRVVCASCNPTGARPTGIEIPDTEQTAPPLIDGEEREWAPGRWLSGVLPVPLSTTGTSQILAVRQPRYLSNGGRLFFDSTDGLAPRDRNGVADTYEYEPPANGETVADGANDTCTTSLATYNVSAEGCVDLVSSGTSPEESAFMEASENGNNVFFLTSERLVPSDTDSAYDVYDAHVCGWQWECPAPSAVSPPCTGTESCRGAPAPQPSLYGSPASATFSGLSNQAHLGGSTGTATKKTTTKKKVAKCRKGRRRVRGRCVKAQARRKARHAHRARAGRNGDRRRGR